MCRWRSRGLLLAFVLAAVGPAAATRGAAGPPTRELTLERALALARTGSPSVRAAQARIGEARGGLVDASRLLRTNPTVELGGGPRMGPEGVLPDLDVGVGQAFELGGKRAARMDAARAEVARATASAGDTLRQALRAVAAAFLEARYAEERLRIATDTERLAAEMHRVARRRYEAGDVGILDVNLAALALARVEAEVRAAEAARVRTLGRLRVLLGLEPEVALVLKGELLDRARYDLDELLARASGRADLRALSAAIDEADAEVRLSRAARWPDLGLRLGYAREEGADLVLGTLTLSLPVFDRGQGLRAVARARGDTLRLERGAALNAVRVEVRTAFESYRRLVRAADAFEETGLPLVARSEALARRSYEAGAVQLTELLAVRRELVEARIAHARLLLDAALAGVELAAEAGVLK